MEVPKEELASPGISRFDAEMDPETVKCHDRMREEWRTKDWPAEAKRIAQSGKPVVRDGEALYVNSRNLSKVIVLRNRVSCHEGYSFTYEAFDAVGQFHVVSAPGSEQFDTDLISDRTGAVFQIGGAPVYSPDKARFFATHEGLGCEYGLGILRPDFDKARIGDRLFVEARQEM